MFPFTSLFVLLRQEQPIKDVGVGGGVARAGFTVTGTERKSSSNSQNKKLSVYPLSSSYLHSVKQLRNEDMGFKQFSFFPSFSFGLPRILIRD